MNKKTAFEIAKGFNTQAQEDDSTCLRCGHSWRSRIMKPIRCPKCMSPYWDKPRKEKP